MPQSESITQLKSPAPVTVISDDGLNALKKLADASPPDVQSVLKAVLSRLSEPNNCEKRMGRIISTEGLATLKESFPNFSEVIDYLSACAAISECRSNKVFKHHPLLLLGPPGIGKTEFARALANAIGTHFDSMSMASATAGWILGGSDLTWSSGKPGLVFNILTQHEYADPVILLDEIDKVGVDNRYNPLGALYDLLEPSTARQFKDEAIGVAIDASYIHWLATGNSAQLDGPLLSRFRVFHIPAPTTMECRVIAHRLYKRILAEECLEHHFNSTLSSAVVDRLVQVSPRQLREALMSALGRAALDGRCVIAPDDVDFSDQEQRRMGFVN